MFSDHIRVSLTLIVICQICCVVVHHTLPQIDISTATGDVKVFKCAGRDVSMYWKDSNGIPYKGFGQLFSSHDNLIFATNGGRFNQSLQRKPLGLYIENGRILSE